MKTLLLAFTISLNLSSAIFASSTRVEWSNSQTTRLGDFFGNPLKGGTIADYDGARLQLGYYTEASIENPFIGNWVPLTGRIDDLYPSSIGDKGNLASGRFNISTSFDADFPLNLPDSDTPLSIRFYDSFSPLVSSKFNAVSSTSGMWNWISPTDPQSVMIISLTDPNLVWQAGAGSAFKTQINVNIPEPSSICLTMGFCSLAIGVLRRKTRLTRQ